MESELEELYLGKDKMVNEYRENSCNYIKCEVDDESVIVKCEVDESIVAVRCKDEYSQCNTNEVTNTSQCNGQGLVTCANIKCESEQNQVKINSEVNETVIYVDSIVEAKENVNKNKKEKENQKKANILLFVTWAKL
ncbi:hypothetical protein Trydic_g17228 [Trypoxylus dichotomus]